MHEASQEKQKEGSPLLLFYFPKKIVSQTI
jgi:hypothetical protein